jgi:hypothetical protein
MKLAILLKTSTLKKLFEECKQNDLEQYCQRHCRICKPALSDQRVSPLIAISLILGVVALYASRPPFMKSTPGLYTIIVQMLLQDMCTMHI